MKTLQFFVATAAVTFSIFAAPGTASAASPFKKVSGGVLHVSSGVIFPSRAGAFRFQATKFMAPPDAMSAPDTMSSG